MTQTGFTQFWIYSTIKFVYYKSKKYYDIEKLPRYNQFLKQWNDKRRDVDGMYFYNLQKYIPKSKNAYLRLFSYYYFENENFHISEIYNDEFRLWKKHEFEINNLHDIVKNDFLKIFLNSIKQNTKLKDVFICKDKIPIVVKLYERRLISLHSLIIFNIVFNIFENIEIEALNVIEKEKIKQIENINRFYKITKKYYENENWKTYLKNILQQTINKGK